MIRMRKRAKAPEDTKVSGSKLGKDKVAGDAKWADLDNNGLIDDRDIAFMGWANPDKKGALINSLTYKNFSFRFVVDFALGHSIANVWRARSNANGRNAIITTTDVTNGNIWWNPGDAATCKIPVMTMLPTGITVTAITCVPLLTQE